MSALVLNNATAHYGERIALNNVSVQLRAGIVTGIVGPNGAGKTSLFRAALGILPTQSGSVRILGRPAQAWGREALARTIAYLPQGADAHWPIAARQLVALGRLPHRRRFAPLNAEDWKAVDGALARCETQAFADRSIDQLSAGERARVLLARALATQAPILLADEPAAHLDPAHQLGLMSLLGEEARRGSTVVVTLHDLSLASRFCDDIVVMHQGRVVAQGLPAAALNDEVLSSVFNVRGLRVNIDGAQSALIVSQSL